MHTQGGVERTSMCRFRGKAEEQHPEKLEASMGSTASIASEASPTRRYSAPMPADSAHSLAMVLSRSAHGSKVSSTIRVKACRRLKPFNRSVSPSLALRAQRQAPQ